MKPLRFLKISLCVLFLASALVSVASASSAPYISRHGINFSTGNKYLHQNDVSLAGPASTLVFSRNYNSQSLESSILGFGWTSTLNDKLTFEGTKAIYKQSDGHIMHLVAAGTNIWNNQISRKTVLTKTTTGYTLTEPDTTKRFFDLDGRLIEKRDRNNNSITLSYDGAFLRTIADGFGRSLTLQYNAESLLATVTSPIGTFTYGYDTNKNLVSVTRPDGGAVQYLYEDTNDVHNLTGVIDTNNTRTQTITYDASDRVTGASLANGSEAITIDYQNGYKRVIANSLGVATTYQLQVLHGVARVVSITGPRCTTCGGDANTSYVYDTRLQTTQATDANGVKTTYTYDAYGNPATITKAAGTALASTTTKTYIAATNRVATISKPSVANPGQQAVETMTYDSQGNLLTRTQSGFTGTTAITAQTAYTYNSSGQITSIDGPRTDVADVVGLAYYPNEEGQGHNRGQLHTVTDAMGHVTIFADYNAFGQAQTLTDPNGITSVRSFDAMGRMTAATTAGLTTGYAYNPAGQLLSITRPGGRTISYSYTAAGQVAGITDNQGNAITYSYDSEGRRTGEEVRDPQNVLARYAAYGYDDNGRMNKVTLPGDAQETSEYDAVGNLVKTINATGMQSDYSYDALNHLLTATEAGVAVSGYGYDVHGNVTQVTDAGGKATSFVSDDFGRKVLATAPDTGATASSYDVAGNLVATTDAKGQTLNMTYDGLNRPVSRGYAGGNILFAYDQGDHGAGRLSRITDSEGTTSFAYDAAGRVVSETRVIGSTTQTIGYNWDATTGEPSGMTYPSALSVSYTRDAGGQISGINLNGAPLVTNISRLPFGPLKTATLGSINLSRRYDQRYNLTGIKAASLDYTYTRDAAGHVTGITGIPLPSTGDTSTASSYNPANNQLTAAPPKTYSYDATGNMLFDGTSTFTWDGLNRLVKVEKAGATLAEYGYDAANRRIRKTVGAVTTHYLYDLNNQLIAETLANGTVLREYIYLDGEPLALKEYQTNPGTYYFINDHLGTPQQLVTATGAIVWQAAYLPFGQAQIKTATVKNNLRFPGQYFDAETGLHYNWNRFYDPEVGRYISADPIGLAGGMNLYAYVGGNPVNLVDLKGLSTTLPSPGDKYAAERVKKEHPGLWKGKKNDKFKHCALACQITKEYGPWTANNAAIWKEVKDEYDNDPNSHCESKDFDASIDGVKIGVQGGNCVSGCEVAGYENY